MSQVVHSLLTDVPVETAFPESPWVVMKFGGSSVATVERWQTIAQLVADRQAAGERPLIVHSALAGVSNLLLELLDAAGAGQHQAVMDTIRQRHVDLALDMQLDPQLLNQQFEELGQLAAGIRLVGEVSPRVHARVMAAGELMASELGSAYLRAEGVGVSGLDARDLLTARMTSNTSERARFLSAVCDFGADPDLQQRLNQTSGVVLTQGFIARSDRGDTVLLGRGGSDTSAAYLAAKLEAKRLEIWTDVPGMFSADPRAVPTARLIRRLHYHEAQEIASAGGGVLHPRCIPPVRRADIPLFLRCTPEPQWEGTVVSSSGGEDSAQLKAVSYRTGVTLISMESMEMWQQVGFMADAFRCFANHGFSVDLVSTSESNVTVSIDVGANVADPIMLAALVEELGQLCRVQVIEDCAAVTLVGRKIRAILHELGPAMEVFEEQKVHLVSQAANDLNLTFVVDGEHAYRLVKRLHGLLINRFKPGDVFGATWEQLSAPARQAADQPASHWWQSRRKQLLGIAADKRAAYVYSRDAIAEACRRLRSINAVDAVFYAMKANSHPDILRLVLSEGLNLECVSPGEINRVLEVSPDLDRRRILFTPNFAERDEYHWALQQGVWLTLDNLHPLKAWPEIFRDQQIMVRTDPGQGRGHHEHVKTAGVHSKFGVPLFELEELKRLADAAGARVVGLHAHTGSGILAPDNWRDVADQLLAVASEFADVRYLDLGGGLGIPERPGQVDLDIVALGAGLETLKTANPKYEFWLEPGRYVVAQAGVLLATVTQTKGKGDVQYVGINTGMNSLIRPALYGAYHEIVNLSRLDEPATQLVNVVGPICETGDRLGSERLLPQSEEGDVLLIANTGAYGYVMSSRYNLREPAEEVLI
jgi:diaminopimelate decarboxylase/aspartate kinase